MQLNSIVVLFLNLSLTQLLSLIALILTIILTIAKIISNDTGLWDKYKQKRREKKERRFLRQPLIDFKLQIGLFGFSRIKA